MNLISAYLAKFKHLRPPEASIKRAVLTAVHSVANIALTPEQVKIQRDVIFLESNPLIKGELMLRKHDVLTAINAELVSTNKKIRDLR